jgi:benzoyl-CoA reductase subunit C
MRWIVSDVPAGEDPLGELARAYLERSTYSPVQHDPRKPKERMLADRVEGAGAGAVIVAAAKMCEPGLEEQVSYVHALDSARVPHFVTEFEENMTTFEQLEIQLETFVENLMFD